MNKRDFIAIGLVVVLSVVGFILFGFNQKNGDTVRISVNSKLYGTYPLSDNREIKIKNQNGVNTVKIEGGKVYISDADCKDKSCVKQGKIDSGSIVCLPHKLVVEVTADGAPDAVAR